MSDGSGRGWPGLELRHLATLEAVVEETSFRRAARRLGYSQSAVSQQVASLERAIGHRIVDRGVGETVGLTEVGAIVMRHAMAIDDHLTAARSEVARLVSGGAELRLGTFPSAGALVVPRLLADFKAAAPSITLVIEEHLSDVAPLRALKHGDLDFTIAVLPIEPGPFRWTRLFDDHFVLVVRPDSALARANRPARLDDFAELPLITPRECRSTACALEAIRSAGADPRVVYRSDDQRTVCEMVAAGLGAAILPSAGGSSPNLVRLDLSGLLPPRVTALVWHEHRMIDVSAELLVDTARRAARRLARPLRASAA